MVFFSVLANQTANVPWDLRRGKKGGRKNQRLSASDGRKTKKKSEVECATRVED